ncbi:MAG: ABC transporter substrate-binding protein [Acidobacteriota bacterium]
MEKEGGLVFKLRRTTSFVLIIGFCVLLDSGLTPAADKVKVAIPSLTLDVSPWWIGVDQGFFKQEGLDVEVTYISGNTRTVQALLSGEVQAGAGGAAAPAAAVLRGAKVIVVSVAKNVMDYVLVSKEVVKKPEDLNNKKIAVSAIGGSSHVAAVMALRAAGADPNTATMIQVGGSSARIAAVHKGSVFAAPVSGTVFAGRGEEYGLQKIVDLAEKGIAYPYDTLFTSRAFATKNEKTVLGLIKGIVRSIRFFYDNKEQSLAIAAKKLRNPETAVLNREWEYVTRNNILQKVPYPTKEGFEALFKGMAIENPKATSLRMDDVVDVTYLDKLKSSGFFK